MSFKDLTILIPTHERYLYLHRLLEYFDSTKIKNLKIFILDSSRIELQEKVANKNYKNLDINQIFFDCEISFWEKVSNGLDSVESEFSVLCADDDFLIMSGAMKAMEFLRDNPEYSSCGGRQYNHSIDQKSGLKKYKLNLIYGDNINFYQSDCPLTRVGEYLKGDHKYISFYQIHTSSHHKKIWNSTKKYVSDFGLAELHPCAASLILGKIKVLNTAYMSREPNTYAWVDAERTKEMYLDSKLQLSADGLSKLFEDKEYSSIKIFNFYQNYRKVQLAKLNNVIQEEHRKSTLKMIKDRLAIRSRIFSIYFKIIDIAALMRAFRDISSILYLINKHNVPEGLLKKSRQRLYGNNTN